MRSVLVFGAGSVALVAAALAASWPFVSRDVWVWLAAAGGVAFAAQFGLHLALLRWREDPLRFVRAVVIGAGGRLAVVAGGLAWVAVSAPTHPVVFMLSLVGFLFGMLLIESGLEIRIDTGRGSPQATRPFVDR